MKRLLLIGALIAVSGCNGPGTQNCFEVTTKSGKEYIDADAIVVDSETGLLSARVADRWGGHSVGQWPKGYWISAKAVEGRPEQYVDTNEVRP